MHVHRQESFPLKLLPFLFLSLGTDPYTIQNFIVHQSYLWNIFFTLSCFCQWSRLLMGKPNIWTRQHIRCVLTYLFAWGRHSKFSEIIESIILYTRVQKLYLAKRILNRKKWTTDSWMMMIDDELASTISVIIWGVRRSGATGIKWIFRSTTMPILKNFARVRSVHGAPFIHTFKLSLSFSCGRGK